MPATTYLWGVGAMAIVLAVQVYAARCVRHAVLPAWRGADAALVDAVLVIAALLVPATLVGAAGQLRPVPVLAVELAVGVALVVLCRSGRERDAGAPVRPRRDVVVGVPAVLAIAGIGVVAVQWVSHVADALHRGMTHPDTLWYHLPFVARFVQEGGFEGLGGLGYEAARWFPFNAHVAHALPILAVGRDVLSPFLNLVWFGVGLLAAWALGRARGAAPVAVLGAAVVLGMPMVAGTQPGQASTDVACAALFLGAIAIVDRGGFAAGPLAIAGLSAGLAIGTKVTVAVPMVVLVLGVTGIVVTRRAWRSAGCWLAGIAVGGAFWFVRNWVETGTPVPWFDVPLGPLTLDRTVEPDGPSLLSSLGDHTWADVYRSGLAQALGPAWPVVAAVVVGVGVALLAGRRRSAFERVLGAVVVAGLAGHLVTPLTGGLSFVFNLRYLTPVLLVAFAALPHALVPRLRTHVAVPVALLFLVVAGATASHRERVEAWPDDLVWPALVVLMTGVVAIAAAAGLARRGARHRVGAAIVLVALAVVGSWRAADAYLDNRYRAAGLHADRAYAYFRDVRDRRVAVFGSDETLPMFGLDLSNEVRRGDDPGFRGSGDECSGWRDHLSGRYDYVLVTTFGFSFYRKPPPAVFDDPSVTVVLRDSDTVVYRLDGPLRSGGTQTAPCGMSAPRSVPSVSPSLPPGWARRSSSVRTRPPRRRGLRPGRRR